MTGKPSVSRSGRLSARTRRSAPSWRRQFLPLRGSGGASWQTCDPIEIQRRTVVSRIADIKASGIRGAIVVHGVNDGLVPYNQGVEMSSALAAAGIPTEFYTVARRSSSESPDDRNDTTGTSYIPGSRAYFNELDGHAWEGSTTHQIMVTSLNRLWQLVDGGREVQLGYRPFLVDSGTITPGT